MIVAITIPASGTTTGATIASLLAAGGFVVGPLQSISRVKILGTKADGSARAAFDVANAASAASFTAASRQIAASADYDEPFISGDTTALRAAAAATIAAIAVVTLG